MIPKQQRTPQSSRTEPGWRRGHGCPTKRHTILGWRAVQRRHEMAMGMTLMALAVGMAGVATALTLLSSF